MQGMTPDELVHAMFDSAEPRPEVASALLSAARAWLLSDGAVPLQRLLGFYNATGPSRQMGRNAYLRRAAALLPGPSDWHRAKQIAAALKYFQGRQWPRWAGLAHAPAGASDLDRELFMVFLLDEDGPPLSPERLLSIITLHTAETAK